MLFCFSIFLTAIIKNFGFQAFCFDFVKASPGNLRRKVLD